MVRSAFFCSRTRMAASRGAHTDAGCTEVIDLVDFQCCIDLIGSGQNVSHLISGYGVQSAAERVELDQIQILSRLSHSSPLRTDGNGTSTGP